MTKKNNDSEQLALTIVKAIQEKKGEKIKMLDLRELDAAVTDFFVICHAQSDTQVEAIYRSIDEIVKKELGVDPFQVEGTDFANWILLDYIDVVAHVFREEIRDFYRLEDLWADAKSTDFE
jgi:ribosome-associated protein